MSDNRIEIKERKSGLILKGFTFLTLSVICLFITLYPYLENVTETNVIIFHLCGGITFSVFATLFIYLLIKECKPDNALILTSRGFVDLHNVGDNIEIEWTNVASVKLLGKNDTPFLGIVLENCDLVMAHMKKNNIDEMRENIEEGLPHILISQKEIRFSAKELKELFVKFVREARVLGNDIPKKPKNNPFSTEDVLRAFGRLAEKEEADENDEVVSPSKTDMAETENVPAPTADEEQTEDDINNNANANVARRSFSSVDTFYELLFQSEDSDNYVTDENIVSEHEIAEAEVPRAEAFQEDFEDKINDEINENGNDDSEDSISEMIIAESKLQNDTREESPIGFVEATCATEEEIPDFNEEDNEISKEINELLAQARSSKITELEKLLNEKDLPFSALRSDSIAELLLKRALENNKQSVEPSDNSPKDSMSDTKEFLPDASQHNDTSH